MEVFSLNRFPLSTLDSLLASIPFYKTIRSNDRQQYDLLLSHSRVFEFTPGEVVIHSGVSDFWLYFLLKGQLAVVVGDNPPKVVNYITPGEVFGDLAVLNGHVRTASVVADQNCKTVLAFGTDFSVFGEVKDTSRISLATKLVYYRNMVHNLRWKLEVYRISYPDQPYASDHRKIKLYSGARDTLEELESLETQARALAKLLIHWNSEFDRLSLKPQTALDYNSLAAIG